MVHWNHLRDWSVGEQLMRSIAVTERILGREESLGSRSVTFSFRVLLECVRNGDRTVAQVLSVHGVHRRVGRLKTREVDEREAFRVAGFGVAHDLWRLEDDAEGRECVVEKLLVHLRVQVADENVGAHVEILLMGRSLVDSNRLSVKFNHVHDLDGVVGVFLSQELHEAVALVHLCDSIFWLVDVHCKIGKVN